MPSLQSVLCALLYTFASTNAAPLQKRSSPAPTVVDHAGVSYQGNLSHNVESFLNIKYGEDTSGDARFSAPKSFQYPPKTIVDASSPGPACLQAKQPFAGPALFDNVTYMSEDCLNLRVDRPENTTSSSRLPVMVYIFGGGYTSGQIADRNYNPTPLILESVKNGSPVLYVAMNYRLGIFGFAASDAIGTDEGLNAGLQDQRLALEWVQRNIESFGGDSNKVTIYGESAGANSVGLQITAYGGSKPAPFKRAIMQSGGPSGGSAVTGNLSAVHTSELAAAVNCTTNDTKKQLSCLRSLPFEILLQAAVKYELQVNPIAGFEVWRPISPSSFIPAAPSKLLRDGKFSKGIDIISGWNENDGSLFVSSKIDSEETFLAGIKRIGPGLTNQSLNTIQQLYALSTFSSDVKENKSAQYFRAAQIDRDVSFTCASLLLSEQMAKFSPRCRASSNYLYVLNQTLFAPLEAKAGESYLGVSHFSDISYVFNDAALVNASSANIKISNKMSSSWISFAATGNPVASSSQNISSTLQDWPAALSKLSNENEFGVRVIGGPNDGATTIGLSSHGGVLDQEDIVRRCQFWNQPSVLEQLQI